MRPGSFFLSAIFLGPSVLSPLLFASAAIAQDAPRPVGNQTAPIIGRKNSTLENSPATTPRPAAPVKTSTTPEASPSENVNSRPPQNAPQPQLSKAAQQALDKAINTRLDPDSLDPYRDSMGVTVIRQAVLDQLAAGGGRKVKVAILDRGFLGWEKQVGKSLPKDTVHIQAPLKGPEDTPHGKVMAEILTSMVWGAEWDESGKDNLPFELTLYNVAGFSNFKAAIDDVIKKNIDMVVYSEVWELGGNFDGEGFINREVSRATDAGVIWINAAGNFGGRTYNSEIIEGDKNLVALPDDGRSLGLVCQPPKGQKVCTGKITLSWNDFKNDTTIGTEKDLDMGLVDANFKKVAVSLQDQVDITGEAGPDQSKYPRETLDLSGRPRPDGKRGVTLKPGKYHILVRMKDPTVWGSGDQMRILVDGDGLTLNHGEYDESLQNPADNPGVITVGASDSERDSGSLALGKPELLAPSKVMEHSGSEYLGSSNATALVGGKAVLLKFLNPDLNRETMIESLLDNSSSAF